MKYCGMVVDDCVFEPTTIGKELEWDLEKEILCTTNVCLKQMEIVKGRYQGCGIKNVSASDLGLILQSFRCLNVASGMEELNNKLDRLLEAKCPKAITES